MKSFNPWVIFVCLTSLLLNVLLIGILTTWMFDDPAESTQINPPDRSAEEKHLENYSNVRTGRGWQYWAMCTATIFGMIICMVIFGAFFGFLISIGVMILILIFYISPEFGFFISLPLLLSYTMDK